MAQEYDDGSKDITTNQKKHNIKTEGLFRAGQNSIKDLSSILRIMEEERGLIKFDEKTIETLAKNGFDIEEIRGEQNGITKTNVQKDMEQEMDMEK